MTVIQQTFVAHMTLSETINMVPLGRNSTLLMTDNDIINASMRPSNVDIQTTVLSPTCVRYDSLSGTDDDDHIQSHAVHEGSHPDSLLSQDKDLISTVHLFRCLTCLITQLVQQL